MRSKINTLKCLAICVGLSLFIACEPSEQQPEGDGEDANSSGGDAKAQPAGSNGSGTTEQTVAKLQDVEKRDKDGNIVGLLEEGLWYRRGEDQPYTGLVVGANKPKNGKQPVTPYNYKREFKDGVQVGAETSWYANGQKRIEMVFENGQVVSTKRWDPDGNEAE